MLKNSKVDIERACFKKHIFHTFFEKQVVFPFPNAKDALLYNGDIKGFYCLGRDGICSSISLSFLLR